MEKEQSPSADILKQENVGYLKSSINLQQGTLVMTSKKISLDAHKTNVGGGLLGLLFKSKIEKSKSIFDLEFRNIQSVAQGKHGVQKNVLEITDRQNTTHRIIVKDYHEWENAIKPKMK